MPLPKSDILASNSAIGLNNNWSFNQTIAPSAGPGALSATLKARINPAELPKTTPTTVTGAVAGYTIEQNTRPKTNGTITIEITEGEDGESSIYFEKLKGLNNLRDDAGEITGQTLKEEEKEGQYTISLNGSNNTPYKTYVIKQAVVQNVESSPLASGEESEFIKLTVTLHFKDFHILGPDGSVLS